MANTRPDPPLRQLRQLDIELPASPPATLRLSGLLAREDVSVAEVAEVIEGDLALAAAVVRTVNSAMFGVLRRVETVAEAVMFLGMREVAGITLELGLRTRFPPSAAMNSLWDAARLRGLLMGRAAVGLGLHAWRAQSAGLFAQSGQAVLCLHAPQAYPALWAAHDHPHAPDNAPAGTAAAEAAGEESLGALLAAEKAAYGLSHELLGASLCRAWGLASDVADFVRERPHSLARWAQRPQPVRALLAMGAVADALIVAGDPEATAARVCPGSGLAPEHLVQTARQLWQRMAQADG